MAKQKRRMGYLHQVNIARNEQVCISDMPCSKCFKPFPLNIVAISRNDAVRQMHTLKQTAICPQCEFGTSQQDGVSNQLYSTNNEQTMTAYQRERKLELMPQFKATKWQRVLEEKPITPLFPAFFTSVEDIGNNYHLVDTRVNGKEFAALVDQDGIILGVITL